MTISTTTKFGGFGFESFGDPLGLGGPLSVLRARAMEGQTVRIAFTEEPIHQSAAGPNDALNPANYVITILAGAGTQPLPVGVKTTMVVGPVAGVGASPEVGFDVQTDRPLASALVYRITARNINSNVGGSLGAPYYADFRGIVDVPRTATVQIGLVDLDINPVSGAYVVDSSGDLALATAFPSFKKRIFRRLQTAKNAFAWLPGYGIDVNLKAPMGSARLLALKADIQQQIEQEPETGSASVGAKLLADNVVQLIIQVKTKTGAFVELGAQVNSHGAIVIT